MRNRHFRDIWKKNIAILSKNGKMTEFKVSKDLWEVGKLEGEIKKYQRFKLSGVPKGPQDKFLRLNIMYQMLADIIKFKQSSKENLISII